MQRSRHIDGYTAERAFRFFERLEDELAAVPGITGLTASEFPLISGLGSSTLVLVFVITVTSAGAIPSSLCLQEEANPCAFRLPPLCFRG